MTLAEVSVYTHTHTRTHARTHIRTCGLYGGHWGWLWDGQGKCDTHTHTYAQTDDLVPKLMRLACWEVHARMLRKHTRTDLDAEPHVQP